jgi:hypothetical protein
MSTRIRGTLAREVTSMALPSVYGIHGYPVSQGGIAPGLGSSVEVSHVQHPNVGLPGGPGGLHGPQPYGTVEQDPNYKAGYTQGFAQGKSSSGLLLLGWAQRKDTELAQAGFVLAFRKGWIDGFLAGRPSLGIGIPSHMQAPHPAPAFGTPVQWTAGYNAATGAMQYLGGQNAGVSVEQLKGMAWNLAGQLVPHNLNSTEQDLWYQGYRAYLWPGDAQHTKTVGGPGVPLYAPPGHQALPGGPGLGGQQPYGAPPQAQHDSNYWAGYTYGYSQGKAYMHQHNPSAPGGLTILPSGPTWPAYQSQVHAAAQALSQQAQSQGFVQAFCNGAFKGFTDGATGQANANTQPQGTHMQLPTQSHQAPPLTSVQWTAGYNAAMGAMQYLGGQNAGVSVEQLKGMAWNLAGQLVPHNQNSAEQDLWYQGYRAYLWPGGGALPR